MGELKTQAVGVMPDGVGPRLPAAEPWQRLQLAAFLLLPL